MLKPLPAPDLKVASDMPVPTEPQPTPSSKPASPQTTPHDTAAKKAADRLFDLIGIRAPGDPQVFIAGVVTLFAHYPLRVMRDGIDPVRGIPGQRGRKQQWEAEIEFYKKILDELHAPILRDEEREQARRSVERSRMLMLPRPPRTPEDQQRIDTQVLDARKRLGIPPNGMPPRAAHIDWGDGNHVARILADLAARKERNSRRIEASA